MGVIGVSGQFRPSGLLDGHDAVHFILSLDGAEDNGAIPMS
jgi:hypothetical protein